MKPGAQIALRLFGFRDTLIWNGVLSGAMLIACAAFPPRACSVCRAACIHGRAQSLHAPPASAASRVRRWRSPGCRTSRRRRDGCVGGVGFARALDRDLASGHSRLEPLVAPLEVVADLVGFDLVMSEDFADRALRNVGYATMSCGPSVLARKARQQQRRPKLVWRANETSHAVVSAVISGALPGRWLLSSAASTPRGTARSRHRLTV
jgi:hypothetical protein